MIKLLAYDSIKASGEANMRPKHSIKHYKQQNKLWKTEASSFLLAVFFIPLFNVVSVHLYVSHNLMAVATVEISINYSWHCSFKQLKEARGGVP